MPATLCPEEWITADEGILTPVITCKSFVKAYTIQGKLPMPVMGWPAGPGIKRSEKTRDKKLNSVICYHNKAVEQFGSSQLADS